MRFLLLKVIGFWVPKANRSCPMIIGSFKISSLFFMTGIRGVSSRTPPPPFFSKNEGGVIGATLIFYRKKNVKIFPLRRKEGGVWRNPWSIIHTYLPLSLFEHISTRISKFYLNSWKYDCPLGSFFSRIHISLVRVNWCASALKQKK